MDTYVVQGNFALRHSLDSLAVTHTLKADHSLLAIARELRFCVVSIAAAWAVIGVSRSLLDYLGLRRRAG